MTASTHPINPSPSILSEDKLVQTSPGKERRDAFHRLRTLSNSFSKQRCSHNRKVTFNFDLTAIHRLPDDVDRTPMFMSYQDKVVSADSVEETCYNFNDNAFVHPYVLHLQQIWEDCGKLDKENSARSVTSDAQVLQKLVNTKARGLEKKLQTDIKRNRESALRQVLDTQKTFKHLPAAARAKAVKNKSKKVTLQAKVFAMTLAAGDAQIAQEIHAKAAAVAAMGA